MKCFVSINHLDELSCTVHTAYRTDQPNVRSAHTTRLGRGIGEREDGWGREGDRGRKRGGGEGIGGKKREIGGKEGGERENSVEGERG